VTAARPASGATASPLIIAGGGIGGLALALALARMGRRSTVVEARERFSAAGAGIQLGPNGVKALRHLGVAEKLRAAVGTPEALEVCGTGRRGVLASLPLGTWIDARHGAPYWTAHRGDVHAALAAAAASDPHVELRAGFELASIEQSPREVSVRSSRGETITGCAVVGADGLWSTVRKYICPASQLEFAGATATRAVLPANAADGLNQRVVGLWLGPRVNVVHYPVRHGSEVAVVIIAREDWREAGWDGAADPAATLSRLDRFDRRLGDTLARVGEWRRWALYRLPPLPRWSDRRLTLIGDAAHPMLPHLAQGGVLALEDAIVLANSLREHPNDVAGAFGAFEALRRRRAARVQGMSRRNGAVYHLPPPLSWPRDAILRLAPGAWLMAGYDWLYGWQPVSEAAPGSLS
jgi:salicylate hydroxylase